MAHIPLSLSRGALPVIAALALSVGCRERAASDSTSATDSALAQDLAMAQRSMPSQVVFNDGPAAATGSASTAPAEPDPAPEPPRARTPRPTPTPTPRRQNPPAAVATTPRPTPPRPAPAASEPAPAPAPAQTVGVIGVGSRVGMTTNGRVCTATTLVGDKFTATVSNTTSGSNGAVIPAGATVVLEVASVERADPIESSRIHFRVRAIDVNGQPLPADGDIVTLSSMEAVRGSSGNDRTKVVGGAVAGAVLGKIFGGSTKATVIGAAAGAAAGTAAARRSQGSDACLPDGSTLRLTLSREIVVQREGRI